MQNVRVKIKKSCKHAVIGDPHLPLIPFIEGTVVEVNEKLADSLVINKLAEITDEEIEAPEVHAESKEKGKKGKGKKEEK